MNFIIVYMQCCIRGVGDFFYFQNNIDLVDLVKILFKFGKFGCNKFVQCFGDFDVIFGNVELYSVFFIGWVK